MGYLRQYSSITRYTMGTYFREMTRPFMLQLILVCARAISFSFIIFSLAVEAASLPGGSPCTDGCECLSGDCTNDVCGESPALIFCNDLAVVDNYFRKLLKILQSPRFSFKSFSGFIFLGYSCTSPVMLQDVLLPPNWRVYCKLTLPQMECYTDDIFLAPCWR